MPMKFGLKLVAVVCSHCLNSKGKFRDHMIHKADGVDLNHPQSKIQREDLFSYRGLPISNSAMILLLIGLQIFAYNYSMRRLMK